MATCISSQLQIETDIQRSTAGWEGSAHDARVLNDAARTRLILPLYYGCFYVGDAEYGLTHFGVFKTICANAALAAYVLPQIAKELYNIRHSSLHKIIEQLYGVVQARCPIQRDMQHGYAFDTRSVIWYCHVFSSTTLLV